MSEPTISTDTLISENGLHQINGHSLYWEMYGSNADSTIVLLHHGLGSTKSWKRQILTLVESGYRVILHDRWGYGQSDPRQEFTKGFLHEDAEETIALLQVLGIENATFVGHSDGGSIAIILASNYPSYVDNLILIAAHIYIEPKMEKGLRVIQIASKASPLKDVLEKEHGVNYLSLVQAWISCWRRHGPRTLDLRAELNKVRCPTLVIQGEKDEHATQQHAQDIAKGITEAKLWLIPEVGHMPPHEISEEFNERIIQFLNEPEPLQVPGEEPRIVRDNVQ